MKHVAAAKPDRVLGAARLLGLGALAVAAAELLAKLALFLNLAGQAIRYPDELDYGEGIVWQQMRSIFAGHGYAPIDGFPSIVFHYTPLFHATTWIAAHAGGFDELATGRTVAMVSTLASALVLGLIAGRLAPRDEPGARIVCGAAAGLIALTCWPVAEWGWLMRVDMIACALSLGGLYLAMLSLERPRLIHLAGLAFVAAVFAKQSMIAAPAATYAVLLVFRPRLALAGLSTSVAVGGAALAALEIATHGGFVRHVFLYNVNRFDAVGAIKMFKWVGRHHAFFAGAALVGVIFCLAPVVATVRKAPGIGAARERLASDPAQLQALMALAYLATAQAMVLLAGKSGSNFNYMIEWLLVVSLFAGVSVQKAASAAFPPRDAAPPARPNWLAIGVVPLAIAWQANIMKLPELDIRVKTPQQRAEYVQLSAMVRTARQPIIADDMVLLVQNGKEVVWEPAIFAELATLGRYDERRIVRMIRNGAFAFLVTDHDRGYYLYDLRYNPAVADAIDAAYPRKITLAGHVVHLPAELAQRPSERAGAELRGAFTSRQY